MTLRHLEWLAEEPGLAPEMVVYEVLPYAPVQADRIIERMCVLTELDVGQPGAITNGRGECGRRSG